MCYSLLIYKVALELCNHVPEDILRDSSWSMCSKKYFAPYKKDKKICRHRQIVPAKRRGKRKVCQVMDFPMLCSDYQRFFETKRNTKRTIPRWYFIQWLVLRSRPLLLQRLYGEKNSRSKGPENARKPSGSSSHLQWQMRPPCYLKPLRQKDSFRLGNTGIQSQFQQNNQDEWMVPDARAVDMRVRKKENKAPKTIAQAQPFPKCPLYFEIPPLLYIHR